MIAIYKTSRQAREFMNYFDRVLIFTDCQSIRQGIKLKLKFSFLSKPDWIKSLFTLLNNVLILWNYCTPVKISLTL
jgi:hypothetical protein